MSSQRLDLIHSQGQKGQLASWHIFQVVPKGTEILRTEFFGSTLVDRKTPIIIIVVRI
jgi:hypothetical protein